MSDTTNGDSTASAADRQAAIQAVITQRDIARARIQQERQTVDDQLFDLRFPEPPRQPSQEDNATIGKLNEAKEALEKTEEQLMLNTLVALNSLPAVQGLVVDLKRVNDNLKAKTQEVQAVAKRLQEINDVITKVNGVLASLTQLAGLLGALA
jgi:hypothetical protein